jgi:polysaccharide chain length determinant protein (PEP-CTERM system associated)
MLGHREMTIQDYAGILKRRFWLLLILPVLFLAGGIGASHLVTPQYMSQTLVIIEQQKVPEDYVKSVVSEDLDERLASMKEQILSRSRLQPIIERYNLFSSNKFTMDDRVEMMQRAIGVKPIPSATGGMPGFFITFKAQDPRTAQQVCSEITSLFTAENLRVREQSAEGTTDFLRERLADSKAKLDEQDAKLAAFEQKYLGRLPEQEGSNANTLQALTTQLDAANQTVNHAQQNVTFLEAMVSQQSRESQRPDAVAGGPSIDDRRVQLKALITQKQELETLYTPDYPDVVAISRKIADLQADIAHAPAQAVPGAPGVAAAPSIPESPQLQQLRAQLHAAQQSLAAAKQEQSAIEERVRSYEAKIEASPMVEEEYKQVTRDHETALQFYNALLTKMNESSMATALERRQEGEQFRLMDAANLPEEPTSPNRMAFAGGGFGMGLALALLIAGLLEYRDTSVRNERDIFAFTKLPTLAIISHIDNLPQRAPENSGRKLFSRANKTLESVSG